ncbi:MAG: hypothetical protein M3406_14755 [Chloroflexota bacterium]|nr:hypothetical protein [Chloroflexota bacterium]
MSDTKADPGQLTWVGSGEVPDDLDDRDEQLMLDVESLRDGFVAVGRESNGPISRAVVLHSADGLGWTHVPGGADRFIGTEFHRLDRVAERLFALGTVSTDDRGGSRGTVSYTDDGQTWIEASGNFEGTRPSSLAGNGSELLLIGTRNSDIRPLAWRSPDGETWTPVELQLPVNPAQADMGTLASLGDGYLAVGSLTAGSTAAPVVWRSDDGVSWSCQLLDPAGFDSAQPFELHRAGNAWLALGIAGDTGGFGASSPGYPVAWASQDGLSWSTALGRDEPVSDGGIGFGGGGEQFIAIGRGRSWTSLDGVNWTLHEQSAGAPDWPADALAVGPDGRLVAVGIRYDGPDADPWITVAELEQSSQPSAANPAARDIGGESCDEVAANYGRLLNTRLMAVLPDGERAAAVATTLTLATDEHLRAAGLAGQCSYAEFAVTATQTLTPDLAAINRVGIDGAPDFWNWFARVVRPRLSVIELPDRSVRDRRVAPLANPPAFGDGPWGPLAVVEAPSDSGDWGGLSGNLRIGERCVTVRSLDDPTPVIWRNSQTHWKVETDTIVFFDPITEQSLELHDGDFVTFGGSGIGPEGGPAPADLAWVNPPDAACLGEAFGVHSLSQVNDLELRP